MIPLFASDIVFNTPIKELNKFLDTLVNSGGYVKVLEGLRNTVIISVIGLVIGILVVIAAELLYRLVKGLYRKYLC